MSAPDTPVEPKILIVEDEAVIAMELEARLLTLGYDVVGCATTGDQALQLAREAQPDLALMDVNIRGNRDGIVVANEIRDQFDIPCIFVTAYGDKATVERASAASPMGYLIKPFSDLELEAAIRVALYKEKRDREVRAYRLELENTVAQLKEALESVRTLHGLLPMCAWCKNIRNDKGYWEEISAYLAKHTEAELSHSICPDCLKKHFSKTSH